MLTQDGSILMVSTIKVANQRHRVKGKPCVRGFFASSVQGIVRDWRHACVEPLTFRPLVCSELHEVRNVQQWLDSIPMYLFRFLICSALSFPDTSKARHNEVQVIS